VKKSIFSLKIWLGIVARFKRNLSSEAGRGIDPLFWSRPYSADPDSWRVARTAISVAIKT
jgi:hypothetical protein